MRTATDTDVAEASAAVNERFRRMPAPKSRRRRAERYPAAP
jgi:hypothetical protein